MGLFEPAVVLKTLQRKERIRGPDFVPVREVRKPIQRGDLDRKSTRLNSSHVEISYAVFCLKKKNKTKGARIHVTIIMEAGRGGPMVMIPVVPQPQRSHPVHHRPGNLFRPKSTLAVSPVLGH